VLIVLPSIVSGLGVLLLLLGVFIDETVLRVIFISAGAILLWLDFFITMAIFRFTVRDINQKLQVIEERVSDRE
jgi:hypothetical protein